MRGVGRALLADRRRGRSTQEQQLGSDEPDPLGAGREPPPPPRAPRPRSRRSRRRWKRRSVGRPNDSEPRPPRAHVRARRHRRRTARSIAGRPNRRPPPRRPTSLIAPSTPMPRPSTSGIPSARATIAACPVGAPPARAIPATSSGRRVGDGGRVEVRATSTAGRPSGCHRSGARAPSGSPPRVGPHPGRRPLVRGSSRRRPRRAHRPAPRSTCRIASSAVAPAAMSANAGPTMPGSRANTAWASKIAPTSSPARAAVSTRERLELGRAAVEGVGQRSVLGSRRCAPAAVARESTAGRGGQRGRRDDQQAPDPHARGPGTSDEDGARHRQLDVADRAGQRAPAAASASARNSSADDVAPGSWCPIDRSPRYEARPFVASIGIVAIGPGLGGFGHGRGDGRGIRAGRRPRSARRPAAGTSASSIVFSPGIALPSCWIPAIAASSAATITSPARVSGDRLPRRRPGPHQGRAVQRPRGPADRTDEGPPGRPQPRAGHGPWLVTLGRPGIEQRHGSR